MMPTLVRGNSKLAVGCRRSTGFTLLEVIIVLLLMGIVSALAVVSLTPDDNGEVHRESEKIAAVLEQASEDARISGNAISLVLAGNHYAFQQLTQTGVWADMHDDIYRAHQLPYDMQFLSLRIGNRRVPTNQPLVFNPSGINQPFTIVIVKHRAAMTIAADPMNRITVLPYVAAN